MLKLFIINYLLLMISVGVLWKCVKKWNIRNTLAVLSVNSSELNDTYLSVNCAIINKKPALGIVLSPNRWQVKTQCWLIFGLTIGNKIWWNFYQNTQILCQKNALENVICKTVAILSGPQGCWAKWEIIHCWSLSISKSYTCLSYTYS